MNVVVLRGALAAEPVERTLPSGQNVLNWELTTMVNEKKRTVPVQWDDPPAAALKFDDGDEVIVAGSVRRRFFRAGGATVSRTEVLADQAAKPTQRVAVRRLVECAASQLTS